MTDKDKVKDEDIIRVLTKRQYHDKGVIDTYRGGNKSEKPKSRNEEPKDPAQVIKSLDDELDERNKEIIQEIMDEVSDEDFVEIIKGHYVTPCKKKVKNNEKEFREAVGIELSELTEAFAEARFEDDNIIRNVCLLSKVSKNNRVYLDEALNNVAGLANGVKVFADHPKQGETVRSVREIIGAVEHPHLINGKVYGNLRILSSHKNWVFAIAKEMPNIAGMSILAKGKMHAERDSEGRAQVESVSVLKSIDLVSEPATTGGMYEQTLGVKKDGSIGKVRVGKKFDKNAPACKFSFKVLCPVYSELDVDFKKCDNYKAGENCPYSEGGEFYRKKTSEEISDEKIVDIVKGE